MKINDRTDGNVGVIHYHGPAHLSTSSSVAQESANEYQTTDQDSVIGQNGKAPIAEAPDVVDTAGRQASEYREPEHAANPQVRHGDGALKSVAAHPVTAYLDGRIGKNASVSSHPHIMRAHQLGSITATDHKAVHGAEKGEPLAKPGSNLPKGGSGMSEVLEEPESVVAVAPASESSTMPAEKVEKAEADTLWAEATKGVTKAQKPIRFTDADRRRNINEEVVAVQKARPVHLPREVEQANGAHFMGASAQELREQADEEVRKDRAAKPQNPDYSHPLPPQSPTVFFGGRQRPVTSR